MARSWQDLPRFSMFLVKMYQVSVHWVVMREKLHLTELKTNLMFNVILKLPRTELKRFQSF